jgi:hypothetical protein
LIQRNLTGVANETIIKPETMELTRKSKSIVITALLTAVLVMVLILGSGHFRYDSKKWAEPFITGSNIITPEKVSVLNGKVLLVNFDNQRQLFNNIPNQVFIPPDSVLQKKYRTKIESNKGPVVLFSSDVSIAVRVWTILTRSGCRNLYILTFNQEDEVLKEKIRPDTLKRPDP